MPLRRQPSVTVCKHTAVGLPWGLPIALLLACAAAILPIGTQADIDSPLPTFAAPISAFNTAWRSLRDTIIPPDFQGSDSIPSTLAGSSTSPGATSNQPSGQGVVAASAAGTAVSAALSRSNGSVDPVVVDTSPAPAPGLSSIIPPPAVLSFTAARAASGGLDAPDPVTATSGEALLRNYLTSSLPLGEDDGALLWLASNASSSAASILARRQQATATVAGNSGGQTPPIPSGTGLDEPGVQAFSSKTPLNSTGLPSGDAFVSSKARDSNGGMALSNATCSAKANAAAKEVMAALQASMRFLLGEGRVDFDFLGDENLTCARNCAFSNPNSPYGLTKLPLSPRQPNPPKDAPDLALQSLKASSAAGDSPPISPVYQLDHDEVILMMGCAPPAPASRYFAVTPYIFATHKATGGGGWSNVFGSMGDSLSMYRSSNSTYGIDNRLNVSSSTQPRSASALDTSIRAISDLWTSFLQPLSLGQQPASTTTPWGNNSSSSSSSDSSSSDSMAQAAGQNSTGFGLADLIDVDGDAANLAKLAADSPFGRVTLVIMTASPRSAAAVAAVAKPVLERLGLFNSINVLPIPGPDFSAEMGLDQYSSYYMMLIRNIVPAGQLAAFKAYAATNPLRAWRLTPDTINLLALTPGVTSAKSTAASAASPTAAAKSAALGVAVGATVGAAMTNAQASVAPPEASIGLDMPGLSSASPDSEDGANSSSSSSSSSSGGSGGTSITTSMAQSLGDRLPAVGRVRQRLNGFVSDSDSGDGGSGSMLFSVLPGDSYPLPTLVPRATIPAQSEAWLQPVLELLLDKVQEWYNSSYALSFNIGSDSALGLMGVDWGRDCLVKHIDFCNGDNRDAQYLAGFPLASLPQEKWGKQLLVVGVNHARTGLASYVNVAVSDPIQRLGVAAFEDTEMEGSAAPFLKGTAFERLAPLMYVVRYARNCTGVPYCKPIPLQGARAVPTNRDMVVNLRAYTDPVTGVGPDAAALVKFRTVQLTPLQVADAGDSSARFNPRAFTTNTCTSSLLGITNCASGITDTCCAAVGQWAQGGCFCSDAGRVMLNTMPRVVSAAVVAAGRLCKTPSNTSCPATAATAATGVARG